MSKSTDSKVNLYFISKNYDIIIFLINVNFPFRDFKLDKKDLIWGLFYCGPTWARTKDHLIMSQVL